MKVGDIEGATDAAVNLAGASAVLDLRGAVGDPPEAVDLTLPSETALGLVRESQNVLADAAEMLLDAEMEELSRQAHLDTPDADRSAGRLKESQLDLPERITPRPRALVILFGSVSHFKLRLQSYVNVPVKDVAMLWLCMDHGDCPASFWAGGGIHVGQ